MKVNIKIEYIKAVNFALCHNRVPVCQYVEIENASAEALRDVTLSCEGTMINPYESAPITLVKPGETIRLSQFEITPIGSRLAAMTERVATTFHLTVRVGEETVSEETYDIDMMPYDHWLGTTILPQSLISFVTPNHPAVNSVILKAAEILKSLTGNSAFTAYQSGNTDNVRKQVAAVYAALHQCGLVYKSCPPSYETVGQRITMPDQLLAHKTGNCIELSLLFASVLESIGINSGIVLHKSHAFLAVWLVDDSYPYSVCDDYSFVEKKCASGIDEMMLLECTMVASENTSFEKSVSAAEQTMAKHTEFEMFLDVKRCRLERFLPLPAKALADGTWTAEEMGVEHGDCDVEVKEHDRYDLEHLRDSKVELTKFDIWERKLLDFSLRNSLLNLYLRRKAVQLISFDVDKIEDTLQDGEEYCIEAKPNVDLHIDTTQRLVRSKTFEELHALVSNDMSHSRLHTYLTEKETTDVLKNIYRAARTAIEETGANSLFLAIGTLRWYETPLSETPRYAPVLLLPVEMVYKKGKYYIRTREEDITLNITLMEYLRQNHDIRVDSLSVLPKDAKGVDVKLIFAILRDALKEQKRWDIEEECILGTFSFSKYLMWHDVHNNREQLRQNDIVSSLVENRLTWTPTPLTSDLKETDENVPPTDLALPVAIDSSQMAAVIEGGKGNSFILYGPPGTGKSQTITNLIANALYQGKRVLFVAEKMAALSVVQSRLEKIGLAPFCLELHSNKSSKRHVLEQLDKALKVVHIVPPAHYATTAEKIFNERKALITYMKALHDKDAEDGLSLYDCILRYESVDTEPMKGFKPSPVLNELIVKEGVKGVEEMIGSRLEAVLKLTGQPSGHQLKGLHLTKEMMLKGDLMQVLEDAAKTLDEAIRQREDLCLATSLRATLIRDNDESIFNEDANALRNEWRSVKAKWFIPRYFAKRSFIGKLRKYNPHVSESELDSLTDNLLEYAHRHSTIVEIQRIMQEYFGAQLKQDQLPEVSELTDAVSTLTRWSGHSDMMRDWLHWSEYADELKEKGMECVVTALENRDYSVSDLRDAFQKALFKHKAERKISASPLLLTFEGTLFDEKVKTYKKLTEEFQLLTQKELYARLAARVPKVTDNIDSSSEIGLLNRNISNGGRGLSLRDLFDQIPTLMPRLCPCMLMSPMSVAQYIDLAQEKFDLVVFDEASQMPTSEAVGAIARGKALIVVGDPKQMPPTSFFSSTSVDEDEAAIDDMESILEDCRTLEIPSLQLSWHYRSRHESLIAFSNNEYYDGTLITFPSVDDQDTKVRYVHIDGVYDKGGRRNNKAEAEAIVNEIARRLKDSELRRKSIGVIAFSVVQQALIEDMLEALMDKDKTLREAAAMMYEPIFIKNLENVQGDERDVILFSIGYGPDKDGKVSMNFGPLNNAGGERRLNVAVSRARHEMVVYSTLRSSQIDLRRSKARGVEGLKHFLEYAETQSLATSSSIAAKHDDTLIAEEIAKALGARGYATRIGVGRSQFKVDIAVCDGDNSDVYKLGILLDGENYRDTQTTRDREIVQPSVLASLNWKVMRVWSVDWYNNKERVMQRIMENLEDTSAPVQELPKVKAFDLSDEKVEAAAESVAKDYVACEIAPSKAAKMSVKALVEAIVKVEQPVTLATIGRRVCAFKNIPRQTQALQKEIAGCVNAGCYTEDDRNGKVVWMSENDSVGYQWYRPNSGRDIADIPMVEIKNVVREAISEQFALNMDNLTLIAVKKLGFTRRGTNVEAAFKEALAHLISAGEIEENNGMVRCK